MLEELELEDLGPIRHAVIRPAAGMTAITGETGAGKSMLLSALKMVSGGAADPSRVRPGASKAWAQAVFEVAPGSAALRVAQDAGIGADDGELFLSRSMPSSGRSRAVMGGKSVPRSLLASVAGELVTIHGQAEQLRIASGARQREFLDRYAGDDAVRGAYAECWQRYVEADGKLERLQRQQAQMRAQADYLRESIAAIDRIGPHEGELEELKEQRDRMEHAADITSGAMNALMALDPSSYGCDAAGACDALDAAIEALAGARCGDAFAKVLDTLHAARETVSDAMYALGSFTQDGREEASLDAINGRIHELSGLVKRWGPTLGDVIRWRDQAAFDVEDLDASPERIVELEEARDNAYADALKAARRLSSARAKAAKELSRHVGKELKELAMASSALDVRVTARCGAQALDVNGIDDIEFLFTPFPDSPALPMGKSASGGELSRLMLAMELAVAERACTAEAPGERMTFIFDEIDAGVGGKAAAELGKRLARLAKTAQVIVVTHLPQVASWADAQFVVAKGTQAGGETSTTVNRVDGADRVGEIARMLSGTASQASLRHASELLTQSTLDPVPVA